MTDEKPMVGSVSGPIVARFWPKVIAFAFPQFVRGTDYEFDNEDDLASLVWFCDGAPDYAQIKAAAADYKRRMVE